MNKKTPFFEWFGQHISSKLSKRLLRCKLEQVKQSLKLNYYYSRKALNNEQLKKKKKRNLDKNSFKQCKYIIHYPYI